MIVIGITGTIGAGKGTIVENLIKERGFQHYSVRAFLIEEIKNRKMPINRDSMVIVANDLRAKNSPSFVTDQLYFKAKETSENCVIESIRTPGEITSLRGKENFCLIAVDAKTENRYERIKLRKSETDMISFETFKENETREMTSKDPNKQNLKICIEMADFVLSNDGSIKELYEDLEKVLKEIEKN